MLDETRPPHLLDAAALGLLRAEETIALVSRATPVNAGAEVERLTALPQAARLRPALTYDPQPDLSEVRRALERVSRQAVGHGWFGALHAARASELELEARMAEVVGTPAFPELARKRFRAPGLELHARVTAFVDAALAEPAPAASAAGSLYASDDHESPASLVNQLRRRAAGLALPIRVEIRPRQLAVAATGFGIVAIRPGILLSAGAASRIALHELLAHALPRARSAHAPFALLRAGTAGSVEGEEGRALLVEVRAGLLDRARRRELALRHLAALSVRRGADFDETVRELVARGAERSQAIASAVRVSRGGGLAREIVYLPAYHEVSDAFARSPELESWFERGRVGLDAARELSLSGAAGEARSAHSSNSMNTGV